MDILYVGTIRYEAEKNKKSVAKSQEITSQNPAQLKESGQSNKHLGGLPCKIFVAILKMEKQRT